MVAMTSFYEEKCCHSVSARQRPPDAYAAAFASCPLEFLSVQFRIRTCLTSKCENNGPIGKWKLVKRVSGRYRVKECEQSYRRYYEHFLPRDATQSAVMTLHVVSLSVRP